MASPSTCLLIFNEIPRNDAVARGYYPWLREIDNPFFSAIPGVVHYTNWRIVATPVGSVPFTHCDLMFLAGPEVIGVGLASAEAQAFAADWVRAWGRFPDVADPGANYVACTCEELVAPRSDSWGSDTLLLTTYTPRGDAAARGYDSWLRETAGPYLSGRPGVVAHSSWRIADPSGALLDYTDLDLTLVEGRSAAESLLHDPDLQAFRRSWVEEWGRDPNGDPSDNYRLAVCQLIATSDAAPA